MSCGRLRRRFGKYVLYIMLAYMLWLTYEAVNLISKGPENFESKENRGQIKRILNAPLNPLLKYEKEEAGRNVMKQLKYTSPAPSSFAPRPITKPVQAPPLSTANFQMPAHTNTEPPKASQPDRKNLSILEKANPVPSQGQFTNPVTAPIVNNQVSPNPSQMQLPSQQTTPSGSTASNMLKASDRKKKLKKGMYTDAVPLPTPPKKAVTETSDWGLHIKPLYESMRKNRDPERADFVKAMTKFAWEGYMAAGRGSDEVRPVSGTPYNWYPKSFLNTPVDAMDTLWLMGLTKEYNEAKELVLNDLDLAADMEVNVFESIIRILGGLLAAYELEGDLKILAKAKAFGDAILPAFDTPTGIPVNRVNLKTGNNAGAAGACLAEFGTMQLEMQYLSDVTGNPIYAEKTLKVYEALNAIPNKDFKGLVPQQVSTHHLPSNWDKNTKYGMAGCADSYYEYLGKMWIATGDEKFGKMFDDAAEGVSKYLTRTEGGNTFLGERTGDYVEARFDHLACFAGGWFTSGFMMRQSMGDEYFKLGEKLTETCYKSYLKTPTGLGPESVDGASLNAFQRSYWLLRPETVESVFYMWRYTHDQKYRDIGWEIAQSIEEFCKTKYGYSGISGPESENPSFTDKMESWFFAETLKYLYLLFEDDDVVPLEKMVLNTEAHPLSIRGQGRRTTKKM